VDLGKAMDEAEVKKKLAQLGALNRPGFVGGHLI
jgi:hypothetical protein